MLDRWTRAVVRWRVAVVALWLGVAVVGLLAAGHLSHRLTSSLEVPGTSSAAADAILARHFHESAEGTYTVVVPRDLGDGGATEDRALRAAAARFGARIVESRDVGGVLYANLSTSKPLAGAAAATPNLRADLRDAGLAQALVTGPPALQHDLTPILQGDLRRGEVVAVVVAAILLGLALGLSGALLVPLLVAVATVAGALGLVDILARRVTLVLYTPNVVALVGLGLAVDYSLLLVHRFRAELGAGNEEGAITRTLATAGRTAAWSALTVAVGLAALLVVPVPFLRSLGLAAIAVPVAALIATFTLQPALLSLLGRRGVTARGWRGLFEADARRGLWAGAAVRVTQRPVASLAGAMLVLGAAASGLAWFSVTPASVAAAPAHVEAVRAVRLIARKVGPGVITPVQVVVDSGRLGGARVAAESTAIRALATRISRDPQVEVVAIGDRPPFVDSTGRFAQIIAVPRAAFGAPATQRLVGGLRALLASSRFPSGTRVDLGGAPSQGADFLDRLYRSLPLVIGLTFLLALTVLARAFRSWALALVAVTLNALSVAAAFGLTVLVFSGPVAHDLLGTYRVSQLEGWVPVFVFAVLFGLSSDYQVFIVSRVREAQAAGADRATAVVEGVARTGAVVTAAAAVMVGALAGLALGRIAGLQELGVGLGLGVVLDATVVRGVALPSLLTLMARARTRRGPPPGGRGAVEATT